MEWVRLTDDQVIKRVRVEQQHRRLIGALCTLFGIVILSVGLLFWIRFQNEYTSFSEMLSKTEPPTPQQREQFGRKMDFYMGVGFGSILVGGVESAIGMVTVGLIWMLTQNRRDRLLLKCWDGHRSS
jgi:hypothetical protein